MIYLKTGTPGASKTLNSIKEVCEDSAFYNRPIYYNNIKALVLDIDFLNSFEGFFYAKYLNEASEEEKLKVKETVESVHRQKRLVNMNDVPFLGAAYNEYKWIDTFIYWCERLYSEKRTKDLKRFVGLCREHEHKIRTKQIRRFNLDWRKIKDPLIWYTLPAGSVIVIDEIQDFFGKRSASAKAPEHISEFNTHRHKGFDLILITQDSSLIDYQLKACVNTHVHYKNMNGGEKVSRLENNGHFNTSSSTDKKNADRQSVIKRDKKFYGSYYSAELHTQKYRMPSEIKKLFWSVPLLIFGIWWVLNSFSKFEFLETENKNEIVILEDANIKEKELENENNKNCITLASSRIYCM